mmetsp:Transcript_21917/g.62167  ORF Transcript_21917/g.62167 Transcript_21917/m.62167 type:complete len:1017 (-) Transcript_21917:33-3083(-)
MERIQQMAAQLPGQVTAFYAGDELYAGNWLTEFQRDAAAWEVCIQALRIGPLPDCDGELLQEFCAQTLGRLARSFGARHPAHTQQQQRDALAELLLAHAPPGGQRIVWKQLALSLTCADLWMGKWKPPVRGGMDELPRCVRRELITLPVDLLFCDRALPLDEGSLRLAAAAALLDACDVAFEELLHSDDGETVTLHPLATWLSALRKALHLLPGRDETAPLQALLRQEERLVALIRAKPGQAAEIALQLARWHGAGCDGTLEKMLSPMLDCLFTHTTPKEVSSLLPLMTTLASGLWPRATLGDSSLDWRSIGETACAVVRITITTWRESCESSHYSDDGDHEAALADAEAALGLWQTFASTVRDGTRAADPFSDESLEESSPDESARPEKRSRMRRQVQWRPEAEHVAACEALPQLFGGLVKGLMELLHLQDCPTDVDAARAISDLRAAADAALVDWASLVGSSPVWQEAACGPLQECCIRFLATSEELRSEGEFRDLEVAIWCSAACARAQAPEANGTAPALAVLELQEALDEVYEPWRTWLRHSAAALAATAPAECCQQMIEWMMERSPWQTFAPELLEITELPYAEGLERLCRLLPGDTAHIALGEKLVQMAFVEKQEFALHADTVKAQSLLLQAVRHAMGGATQLLCAGLAQRVLPALRAAVDGEAEAAMGQAEPAWHSAQVLFATLATALPPDEAPTTDTAHPSADLWREHWPYAEAALLRWPASSSSDQPAAAAAHALERMTAALPGMLTEALQLLAQSAARSESPRVQLDAIRAIAGGLRCPPCDAARAAELLAEAVAAALEPVLSRQAGASIVHQPTLLASVFQLLADVVRPSPPGTTGVGLCNDQLRPRLLSRSALLSRCGSLIPIVLPNCSSVPATTAILLFVAHLVGGDDILQASPERQVVASLLPELCAALCSALASTEHLADLDGGLTSAADFLLGAAAALPQEFAAALSGGLQHQQQLSGRIRDRLKAHISNRASYPKLGDWLRELQDIVGELQRESRKVAH